MAQQTPEYYINDSKCFTINPPSVIIYFGNAKLCFDKQQITPYELLDVYIKLQNYLNTIEGFSL
jgi:hypothetical protein